MVEYTDVFILVVIAVYSLYSSRLTEYDEWYLKMKLGYAELYCVYSYIGEEFAPLFFSNEAGLSTKVAEQLIPTWAKFNGETIVLSPASLGVIKSNDSSVIEKKF